MLFLYDISSVSAKYLVRSQCCLQELTIICWSSWCCLSYIFLSQLDAFLWDLEGQIISLLQSDQSVISQWHFSCSSHPSCSIYWSEWWSWFCFQRQTWEGPLMPYFPKEPESYSATTWSSTPPMTMAASKTEKRAGSRKARSSAWNTEKLIFCFCLTWFTFLSSLYCSTVEWTQDLITWSRCTNPFFLTVLSPCRKKLSGCSIGSLLGSWLRGPEARLPILARSPLAV